MKTEVIKQRLKLIFSSLGRITVFAAAIAIGFGLSQFHFYLKNRDGEKVATTMPAANSMDVTSIAINERGELMMIDRSNGHYQIYSDTVGKAIFNLYAGQMYAKMNSK